MNIRSAVLVGMVAFAASAAAQNSDLSVLFNVTRANSGTGPISRTEYRIGTQVSYAWQFLERKAGRLYVELPFSSSAPVGIFITPGLRYQFNVKPRLAIYAVAGAGIAIRQRRTADSVWKGSPAFDAGGGLSFRLTRLVSLRGELRTFRTTSVPDFRTARNYPSAHLGIGFHF